MTLVAKCIFSSGYKEFIPLFLEPVDCPSREGEADDAQDTESAAMCRNRLDSDGSTSCSTSVASCMNLVVQRSLHYAKEQRKWIKNKFLVRRVGLPLFFLEATDGKISTTARAVTSKSPLGLQVFGSAVTYIGTLPLGTSVHLFLCRSCAELE